MTCRTASNFREARQKLEHDAKSLKRREMIKKTMNLYDYINEKDGKIISINYQQFEKDLEALLAISTSR